MTHDSSVIPTIDVREADRLRRESADESSAPMIVDVRERSEMIEVRVDGAVALPMSELAARYRELPTDRLLLIVCASGKRSALAARHLSRNGYRTANVSGGTEAWVGAGLPTRRGPLDPGEGDPSRF